MENLGLFLAAEPAALPGRIRRLLVEDSSVQTLPKANAETFPIHGNRHDGTAGVCSTPRSVDS